MKRKAIFLDRDGVLNEVIFRDGRPGSPRDLNEFRIMPAAEEALLALRRAGYLLIVVTNQPEVSRRLQDRPAVESMHDRLMKSLPLDDVRVCYHDDDHACECRKPAPGLLLSAARDWGISLIDSFLIGDRGKDMEAGRRVHCKTVLLACPYNENEATTADYRAGSLLDATRWILATSEISVARPPALPLRPAL